MGKSKKHRSTQQQQNSSYSKGNKKAKGYHPYNKSSTKPNGITQKPNPSSSTQASRPDRLLSLPLEPTSKILLLGEGDFSFSVSLVTHHGCTNLTATTFETQATLITKHPHTAPANTSLLTSHNQTLLYSIDATKLGKPGLVNGSHLRKNAGTYDTVWFNFPHVGGKSTDVNRQVRANQALVVGFLEGALRMVKPGGAVVVVLFEGMPYELWGVRNLARHVGLKVERSGRFEWERFPGYEHARTLGDIKGSAGWKGNERDARVYVFRKEGGESGSSGGSGGVGSAERKRKRVSGDEEEEKEEQDSDDDD
jgi:25S rRNA (uracil2634-N3)-methyltransferase